MLALNAGYAHCLVYRKKWFATLYASPGIARFSASTFFTGQPKEGIKGQWTLRLETRFSVGYNTEKYFGGILLSSFLNNVNLEYGESYSYGFQTVRVFFGKRFGLRKQLGFLGL
jgi:hypothetical protein